MADGPRLLGRWQEENQDSCRDEPQLSFRLPLALIQDWRSREASKFTDRREVGEFLIHDLIIIFFSVMPKELLQCQGEDRTQAYRKRWQWNQGHS
jgi:hypothetical protein